MTDTRETDAEKADRWYREYESTRAQLWKREEEARVMVSVLSEIQAEAYRADKVGKDVSPKALLWIMRDVFRP